MVSTYALRNIVEKQCRKFFLMKNDTEVTQKGVDKTMKNSNRGVPVNLDICNRKKLRNISELRFGNISV